MRTMCGDNPGFRAVYKAVNTKDQINHTEPSSHAAAQYSHGHPPLYALELHLPKITVGGFLSVLSIF